MSFWDTIRVGERVDLGSHLFEAADIQRFAGKFDPQLFHLDAEAAKASVLGGLCASGWHTVAVFMRLNVDTTKRVVAEFVEGGGTAPKVGPSPGVTELRWLRPVFAGDTIRFFQTVTAKRISGTRHGWGVMETTAGGENQNGELVFSMKAAAFMGTD
ncbi:MULTISPECIES: MaoC family dehydratase [unclassified Aureimonas]|uniref:MaoC family dehydratase n=1 Tax=unclassified Aureimonas TaxID=2615206 RepID=UPI0006FA20C9|nr:MULTISPECIES: MaoC family dehydratase [unclassified Aureimonas]KQT66126.1 dehydratase [Aureimonas sp. Leaf427]KQT81010.1 dehydratase [Aureimonas sp. Leaf460]